MTYKIEIKNDNNEIIAVHEFNEEPADYIKERVQNMYNEQNLEVSESLESKVMRSIQDKETFEALKELILKTYGNN